MLIGPVFTRELAIAPRRTKLYVARTAYALSLLVLACTAWLVLTGTQLVRDVGDLARFGTILFQILAPLQLALAIFFAALLAASEVAHEKDRRTLVLLLLTNLSNCELVLGKLLASLLNVLVLLAAALPVFFLTALLGGVSYGQIARATAVTAAAVLACGSLGSLLALWRDKTFQALALTVLALVAWLALGEIVAAGALGESIGGLPCRALAAGFSPWQAIQEAARPYVHDQPALGPLGTPVNLFLLAAVAGSLLLNGTAIAMVRVWNPSREVVRGEERGERRGEREGDSGVRSRRAEDEERRAEDEERRAEDEERRAEETNLPSPFGRGAGGEGGTIQDQSALTPILSQGERELTSNLHVSTSPNPQNNSPLDTSRPVWDNPVIWREIRTRAYGRKMLVVRLAYLVLCGLAAAALYSLYSAGAPAAATSGPLALTALMILSLVLVNAQAVTSITSERDARALDLLLVTDLTPKEIVFGKLGGAFYNTKEMVLLPMLLCAALWPAGILDLEHLLYVLIGLAVMYAFAAALGLHVGMTYANSGAAVAASLGTVFFLLIGVAACMRIMMSFSGSFSAQLLPFVAFMVFGGAGLYAVLGSRNPSTAIGLASFLCPFATFYAITSVLMDPPSPLAALLATAAAYGFTTAAMLVPAICEFDVATGRTTVDE